MQVLGVDIGGSAVKAAPVDVVSGTLPGERLRLETPDRLDPSEMVELLRQIVERFAWRGPVGIGFPAALRDGVALTAANIAPQWLHADLRGLFAGCCRGPVAVINDADAAGLAEMRFGAGRGVPGVVLVVTIGTGLGTALFSDGRLLPNSELGHLIIDGREAETFASAAARQRDRLDWATWAKRLQRFLGELERLFWPDLIILGGGASHDHDKFISHLEIGVPLVPAALANDAGIVGAALAVSGPDQENSSPATSAPQSCGTRGKV